MMFFLEVYFSNVNIYMRFFFFLDEPLLCYLFLPFDLHPLCGLMVSACLLESTYKCIFRKTQLVIYVSQAQFVYIYRDYLLTWICFILFRF